MHVSAYLSKYVRHYLKCYFKKWRVFLWNSIPFLTVWMSPNLKKKLILVQNFAYFSIKQYIFCCFSFFGGGEGGLNSLQYVDYLILRYFSFIRIFYYLTCSIYLTKNQKSATYTVIISSNQKLINSSILFHIFFPNKIKSFNFCESRLS